LRFNRYGIYAYGDRTAANNPLPVVSGNSLYANTDYDYYSYYFAETETTILDATGNWWGGLYSWDGPAGAKKWGQTTEKMGIDHVFLIRFQYWCRNRSETRYRSRQRSCRATGTAVGDDAVQKVQGRCPRWRQVSITLASRVKVRNPASQRVPIMMRRAMTQMAQGALGLVV
jgi:hypothetical protein